MSKEVRTCDRCNAKIIQESHHQDYRQQFLRYTDIDADEYEVREAQLCNMCRDDLWEFVFDDDIDRSEKADPLAVRRMAENVERHISELEGVLEELEGYNDE